MTLNDLCYADVPSNNYLLSHLHCAGLSERLFSQLESSTKNERHEVKLMMTNLISRLVGIHQVCLAAQF